ncbi:peptidoglycan-binding protein [Rhodococcus sp. I2R]|uniref:peptidoglycan-binding protein n=1 Tax=Rhodococcus sp. I2R TaxID=2855445 RepID=UPI0035A93405|nr:peptidoglycan-binding protein [Rhodococcus sp. I2R]
MVTTENGWAQIGNPTMRAIVGTNIVLPLHWHACGFVLAAFAGMYNREIEPLDGGARDEGGWTPTNSVRTSNHVSGTAIDLNWNKYPFRVYRMARGMVTEVKALQRDFRGLIDWGRDCWGGNPVDEMHYQVAKGKPMDAYVDFENELRAGLFGLYGNTAPTPVPVVVPNPGVGGGTTLLLRGSKGEAVRRLQARLNRDYPLYARLVVDGDFGPATEGVVREFQKRAGLLVDGIAGPETHARLGL